MRIDLNNYEVWMIDYLDGNLDDQQSNEVEAFLLKYPHIASEMEDFNQIQLDLKPNSTLEDSFKSKLKQLEIINTENINEHNYEEFFIAFYENDLNNKQQIELEIFLSKNPFLKKEFESYGSLKLLADKTLRFSDKSVLLKKERKLIPLWIWPSVAAAILIIGFWFLNPVEIHRPVYAPKMIASKDISPLIIDQFNVEWQKTEDLLPHTPQNFLEPEILEYTSRTSTPVNIASIAKQEIYIDDNQWFVQMELMRGYAFERNQLLSQVDWSAIPSENSKSGFRLISSLLWKTTKSQAQNIGEEMFGNNIQALSSNSLETITGGVISIKRPVKEVE